MSSRIFEKIDDRTYKTVNRNSTMHLIRSDNGGWEVWTRNPSTRAWGNGPSVRYFDDLKDLEAAMVSWRGITDQIASEAPAWDEPSLPTTYFRMSDVIAQHLILERKDKYTRHDVESLIVDSLFMPKRFGGRTLSAADARFIVICSAIYHDCELSEGVLGITPLAPVVTMTVSQTLQ